MHFTLGPLVLSAFLLFSHPAPLRPILVLLALSALFAICISMGPWAFATGNDGYCYLIAFKGWRKCFALISLGRYPDGAELEFVYFICYWRNLHADWSTEFHAKACHLQPLGKAQSSVFEEDMIEFRYGAEYIPQIEALARSASRHSRRLPTRDALFGEGQRMVSEIMLEAPTVRPWHVPGLPRPQRRVAGDADRALGESGRSKMNAVSAMEAARVLLSGMDSLGPTDGRVTAALEAFEEGITTAVPPSDERHARLTRIVGPLRYTPGIVAHPAAATMRRAALINASAVLQGAIVGLISPSNVEIHTFPRAAIWFFQDTLDMSRRTKHCTRCRAPRCKLVDEARAAGRLIDTQDADRAAALFKQLGVSSILMLNIEPNFNACDVTRFMTRAEVYSGYSLVSVDWRVLLGKDVYDHLIGMRTEVAGGTVVSSFEDGGDYVQSMNNVKQLFRPTSSNGHALRRTIVMGDGATQYFELTLSRGGLATRCVPQHEQYYFVKLIMPDMTRPVVLVERKGFDRVLATYRTQAVKDENIARIVLRQANVTYSISGTQVTPRVRLTSTEYEALAVWVVVYSEVQDSIAARYMAQLRPSGVAGTSKSLFAGAAARLSSAPGVGMALGAASSIDALLRAYRTEFDEMTLDQISNRCLEELFGPKLDPLSLQNAVMQRWQSAISWICSPAKWVKQLDHALRDGWALGFTYVDAIAVTILIAGRFSIDGMRAACDCVVTVARMTGRLEVARSVERWLERGHWAHVKATKAWVACQDAQALDFQAASIDIIETFFNVFGTDHGPEIQSAREKEMISAEVAAELELNDQLPYSDFLSEIKLFLGKFNSHSRRFVAASGLLNAFQRDCRSCSPSQRDKMVHLLKEELKVVPQADVVSVMAFALGGTPTLAPIPLRPIEGCAVRDALRQGTLALSGPAGAYKLTMLKKIGGEFDFSPIHSIMDVQHPNGVVNAGSLAGPNIISPDAKGAHLQEALVNAVVQQAQGASIVPTTSLTRWYDASLRTANIEFVKDILIRAQREVCTESVENWICHITGLAFGGKSKGIRAWISANDLVVVPTKELKMEWQENLGKCNPAMRASVVTQHEALVTKYASRFVFIDECYAFDPEHLQAIANRHRRSKGIITIGDRRQIPNVFSPTALRLVTANCPCIIITPTTFMPADAAAIFLDNTTSDVVVEEYFCGSEEYEGLCYTLSSDDTLLPGLGDISIQGTQVGKEMMRMRGAETTTVHEAQGRRASNTIMHFIGKALTGDLRWLSMPDQQSHLGVAISRAGSKTVMVVDALRDLNCIRWFDETAVNGVLPTGCIFGGTSWDLVEPRTADDAKWEHITLPEIRETSLTEVPLTNPITIGTIFADGDAVAASELTTNVELTDGVRFIDEGIKTSDEFDKYTLQPRDIPGADQVQALTRAVKTVAPSPLDFDNAEEIVSLIFEEYIDRKTFFAHLANSKRATLKRQTRAQVLDGCYASYETSGASLSFAFLKPEFSKKPSELINGPSEIKAQGVITASALQQALFADVCDALTHAWARAQRPGKMSPVGLREDEVEGFLGTFANSYELDIEKQDSSHKAVHVLVANRFLEMASEKMGLAQVASEIRSERVVRMMGAPFKFTLGFALASGDPWTLIINKIMAVSSLISVAKLADCRVCQSGDDITLDRVPEWRGPGLTWQHSANKGLTWKAEERSQRENGVTFISRAALPNQTFVYKALRTILKYAYRPRNSIQHAGISADAERILKLSAKHGLQAYCEARAKVWGGDSTVIYDMWCRALHVAQLPFEELATDLRSEDPRHFSVRERDGGCFGYALGCCVKDNVAAINAVATYRGAVNQTTGLKACEENNVPCVVMAEKWANRSRTRLLDMMSRRKFTRSFVVIYLDHAVAVVPNTITLHTAIGKRTIEWRDNTSRDVIIKDFD